MNCPYCGGSHLKVVDSREKQAQGNAVIRRRECQTCGIRFNTKEVPIDFIQKEIKERVKEKVKRTKKQKEKKKTLEELVNSLFE